MTGSDGITIHGARVTPPILWAEDASQFHQHLLAVECSQRHLCLESALCVRRVRFVMVSPAPRQLRRRQAENPSIVPSEFPRTTSPSVAKRKGLPHSDGKVPRRESPGPVDATEETDVALPRAPMNAPAPEPSCASLRLSRASTSPFSQHSFRFQWPSDLAVSWAFETETLLLAWFVLVETGSVVWLTAFGALQFIGTLISPLYGVAGDRLGQRRVLSSMRAAYVAQAACIAALALSDQLSVMAVFIVAFFMGLVRPSDIGVRNALIAATMPAPLLAKAIGIERVSMDGARVVGALTGAGIVAVLGMGQAYVMVAMLYLISFALTFGIREPSQDADARRPASILSIWQELGAGVAYASKTPALMAALFLACLANFAAYPLTGGLLPHVAREVYEIDQTGLGTLFACFSGGAVLGSLLVSLRGVGPQPARVMMVSAALWFALLMVFAQVESVVIGMALLMITGFLQSLCMVPMSVLILRITAAAFRGRVMGLRMLAIYGLPVGLLLTGLGIASIGFAATATFFAGFGLLATLAIAWHWRAALWRMPAT